MTPQERDAALMIAKARAPTGEVGMTDVMMLSLALLDFAEMLTWKPIETAPRDGSPILVFGGGQGRDGDPVEAEYMGVVRWWDGPGAWHFGTYDSGYYGEWFGATHWMPLPPPPALKE